MHPLLAVRTRLALYLGAWAGIAALLIALLVRLSPRPVAGAVALLGPLAFVYAFVCLSAWWVCRWCPLERAPSGRIAATVLGASIQAAAAWTLVGFLWARLLASRYGLQPGAGSERHDAVFLFVVGVVLYLQSVAFHYGWLALEAARAAERRVLESQVTAREAELRALRAQLHPHFLFNSLNSISALTGPDPEGARRMSGLLGDFLRTSLALGARERVPLSEELALAGRYLAIETVRFGERLTFESRVDDDAGRCLVPPLLIQPLVENAVKHGIANRVEGGLVSIEARRRRGFLEISVENPRDPEAPSSRGGGLGLENVRRRLAALDPGRNGVQVDATAERFRVVVTLPAVDDGGGEDDGR